MKQSSKKQENAALHTGCMLVVTWALFTKATKALVRYYADYVRAGTVKTVYGVPRGGLPLAVAVSHGLGVPLITDRHEVDPLTTLVIDDVIESGETMDTFPVVHFAAWFDKSEHQHGAIVSYLLDPDTWLIFPWENREKAESDRAAYTEGHKPKRRAQREANQSLCGRYAP